MSQISKDLCPIESSNMVYIRKISHRIVESILKVMAFILLFLSFFFFLSVYPC